MLNDGRPVLVPGRSAAQLLVLGFKFELMALLCLVPAVLESKLPGPTVAWAVGTVSAGTALIAVGLTATFRSFSRARAEALRGYTTLWKRARDEPELVYVDPYDRTPMNASMLSRPRTGRPADVDEAKRRTAGGL